MVWSPPTVFVGLQSGGIVGVGAGVDGVVVPGLVTITTVELFVVVLLIGASTSAVAGAAAVTCAGVGATVAVVDSATGLPALPLFDGTTINVPLALSAVLPLLTDGGIVMTVGDVGVAAGVGLGACTDIGAGDCAGTY